MGQAHVVGLLVLDISGCRCYASAIWREWHGRSHSSEQWKAVLAHREDTDFNAETRSMTYRGWPLGTDSFISKLEKLMGRRMRPLPLGRPRKKA